ncbi:MAG TPA: hypothetical protein VHW23_31850 [Kofleriaceae bacterium]|jgi:hypothetical protein|nr:hypothetical protein [Kofleriaceae bacterium]
MTKILLSACTACAFGQAGTARAQNTPVPPPSPQPSTPSTPSPSPIPSDTPTGPSGSSSDPNGATPAATPTSPDDQPTTTPSSPAVPDTGQPGAVPAPPNPPDSTTTTTTTTTTVGGTDTNTGAAPVATTPPPPPETENEGASSTEMFAFDWHNPKLLSGIGVSTTLGGGVVQFTNGTMRGTTSNIGGLWDLHITAGTHLPLALDLAYVGSATHIGGLPTGGTATLIGSAAEGTLRFNLLPNLVWTPYVFGGVGYQRYDVTGGNVSLSDSGMNSSDNLLSVPAGLGFVWRGDNGLVADIHGTYRFTWFQDTLLKNGAPINGTNSSDNFVKMNNWTASAAIGYEF